MLGKTKASDIVYQNRSTEATKRSAVRILSRHESAPTFADSADYKLRLGSQIENLCSNYSRHPRNSRAAVYFLRPRFGQACHSRAALTLIMIALKDMLETEFVERIRTFFAENRPLSKAKNFEYRPVASPDWV